MTKEEKAKQKLEELRARARKEIGDPKEDSPIRGMMLTQLGAMLESSRQEEATPVEALSDALLAQFGEGDGAHLAKGRIYHRMAEMAFELGPPPPPPSRWKRFREWWLRKLNKTHTSKPK